MPAAFISPADAARRLKKVLTGDSSFVGLRQGQVPPTQDNFETAFSVRCSPTLGEVAHTSYNLDAGLRN